MDARRETASKYLKEAGISIRPVGRWGRTTPKAANEVTTDSDPPGDECTAKSANEVTADLFAEPRLLKAVERSRAGLRFRLQQEDEPEVALRAGHRPIRRPSRSRPLSGAATGKSHVAQAIGYAVIQAQGHRVAYREAHRLLEDIADAQVAGERKELLEQVATVPLLIIDDLGMRKLPANAAEDLLELVMRRYERASTLITSNRPVEDWGKLLGDTAGVAALLDRMLHHGHVVKFGPRSWRTKSADLQERDTTG